MSRGSAERKVINGPCACRSTVNPRASKCARPCRSWPILALKSPGCAADSRDEIREKTRPRTATSDIIGSVANTAGCRDRDPIDRSFVPVVGDWLDPIERNLYRCVGDVSDLRLLQAGIIEGNGMRAGDSSRTPLDALPARSSIGSSAATNRCSTCR
jgi:hypothetical protein